MKSSHEVISERHREGTGRDLDPSQPFLSDALLLALVSRARSEATRTSTSPASIHFASDDMSVGK